MIRTIVRSGVLTLILGAVVAPPARAQQSLNLNVGYFAVRGEDARVQNDVLAYDRTFLTFNLDDFSNASIGGEWLVGVGDFVEAGVGIGYYRRTVPSVYTAFVNSDGSEIDQVLKLRIVPITATVRLLPLGRTAAVQPYVGGGVGIFNWRYSETGQFVDFTDRSIFRASYAADGTDVGPVVFGGARVPIGSSFGFGGEIRYQKAQGSLPGDFLTDRIDLGGYTYQATFQLRF